MNSVVQQHHHPLLLNDNFYVSEIIQILEGEKWAEKSELLVDPDAEQIHNQALNDAIQLFKDLRSGEISYDPVNDVIYKHDEPKNYDELEPEIQKGD